MASLLERAADVPSFLAAPLDRYVVGRGWLAFYRKDFSGFVLWGRLDVEVARSVAALLHARVELPPHPSILDLHLVDHFDIEVLQVRKTYRELLFGELKSTVTRLAIVHPPGILAMTVVGLHSLLNVLPPPFPEAFFADTTEALRWLDRESSGDLLSWLHEIPSADAGMHPSLQQVRRLLDDRRPDAPSIADAARILGLSERSLQRRLADAKTSYQSEVGRARLRHAQSLLLMPDANVTEVAFKVGCASPQHLSTLFKKLTGLSPTEWREQVRDSG